MIVVICVVLLLVAALAIVFRGRITGQFRGLKVDARGPEQPSDLEVAKGLKAEGLEAGHIVGSTSPRSKPGKTDVLGQADLKKTKLGNIIGEGSIPPSKSNTSSSG